MKHVLKNDQNGLKNRSTGEFEPKFACLKLKHDITDSNWNNLQRTSMFCKMEFIGLMIPERKEVLESWESKQ